MQRNKRFYVYILASKTNTVLYVGITNHLLRRVHQHKSKLVQGFTTKYNVNKLVYVESFETVGEAIYREKQLKAGSRVKKIELIKSMNPDFKDLYREMSFSD